MQGTKCKIEYDDGILIIHISGDIDHHSAKPLREEIDTNLYLYRANTVILDLQGVDFMDSSGLGLILGRYTKINDLGGRLILANPDESVLKILALAGTDKLITIKKAQAANYSCRAASVITNSSDQTPQGHINSDTQGEVTK